MKTKLLISTALVAIAFTNNAFAEDFIISKKAKILPAGTYDKIDIDTGVVFFDSFLSGVNGKHAKANEVYLHGDFEDPNEIDYDSNNFGGGDGKPSLEYPFQIGKATLEVEGTFKAENTRFDVAESTLIADKIITENTDITTMCFGEGENGVDGGNDFVLAGKNYNAENGTANSYILTNELTLDVTGDQPMGIGDDRINFTVEDGVTLNLKGLTGMVARSVRDDWEDVPNDIKARINNGEDVDLSEYQYRLGTDYGKLTINGGTVNLSGNSVMLADHDITINNGIVNFNDNSQIVSLTFFDADNATLENDDIFKNWGRLDGAYGNFSMTGGTVNINGNNKITGKDYVTIAGGTLNIKQNATLSNVSLNGDSFGNTGFFVTDSGVMDIKGTLKSIANIEGSSPVAIANGGILRLSHNHARIESAVGVLNGGTLEIGKNTPTITGPVIFSSGSTFDVTLDSKSAHGVLNADVIFKDGASITISHNKNMKVGEKFNNVQLINGQVNAENTDLSNGRFNVILNNEGKFDIEYSKTARDRASEMGDMADAWDGLDVFSSEAMTNIKDLLDNLSQYNEASYVDALKALAPDIAPAIQQASTETANAIFGAVGTRLSGGSVSPTQGMNSGDNPFTKMAVWVQGLFNKAKLDNTSSSKGFDSKTYGTAMGIEGKLDKASKLGIGYAYSKTDIDGFMRDTDVKTHTTFVYGEYKPNNWYVNTILSYGWSDYDEKKNVAGVGVKADWNVESFAMQMMTGYDMMINSFGFTPEVGVRYVHIKQDEYKDSADQKVSGNKSDILTGVIGAKLSKDFILNRGVDVRPELKAAMTYDVKNDKSGSVVTLANGSSYSVKGKALDRFGIELGTGVTTEINDNVEFYIGYEGKFREDYEDHTGLINVKYNF